MTLRDMYIKALTFEDVDKIPLIPGYPRESTLKRWYTQGLKKGENYFDALCSILGIEYPKAQNQVSIGVIFKMIPEFKEEILEHKNGHYIVRDWMGAITEISDEYDFTYIREAKDFVTRKWHKFPVENYRDWEDMKWRYDINTPGRFPEDFFQRCEILRNRDYPLILNINGPFWQLREWCGFENLCIFMIDKPDFVREMATFWGDFVSNMLDKILPYISIDKVIISEDMAYKGHSMISPKMVYEYLVPVYNEWILRLKKYNCPIISIDSDGYIAELLPIWIEVGINCTEPVEVAAGNDIVQYRKLYGRKMAFIGGIDKRAIAKGGKVMKEEVMRVVPPLLKDGGYIPSCDHGVPPDISWPNYVEYTRLLAKLTGWLS
ncbi:Uroporphyrinogen decarboxylase (URO-D) [Caldanaerobius fijiensis DSM 17918]|uniref:Uroporphyrinogen decarboxylase (URO-D) n=1 Tax=Caldanaerobius fijiensis DSM 17918 TaxID=1121256 RepID=A0A1M5CRU4_9THEO|nr:uroporphyrinogen decarboxylase family protein [Caldanaerobius fijiensis]SHF57445.1 Uroporphyrinogen decarboxylase (URO-D) [Caldanaerobius fijiensis DSM 17918]